MKSCTYVILNPSGNLTALVTEWGGQADEAEITRRLMKESEQVAYLEAPSLPGAVARLRLMGSEFCGNAAMAAAGWLVRDELRPGAEITVPLEVSGAPNLVFCRLKGVRDGCFEGTVNMPPVTEILRMEIGGTELTAVRSEGILHLIREGAAPLAPEEAEKLLREAAARVPDPAVGLLDRNPETGFTVPLVFVRAAGTLVRETACGSGSAAIAAAEALRAGGKVSVPVPQPGGIIRAEAAAENSAVTEVSITGNVLIGEEAKRLAP